MNRDLDRRGLLKVTGASVAALGLTAAGCGGDGGSGAAGDAEGPATLRFAWWGGEPRAVKIKKAIALFEKKNPKIKIKPEFTDYQAFWEKFQTQASGGNPPDVFLNSVAFLAKYDKRGVLLDLKSQVDAGNLSLKQFRGGVETAGQVSGGKQVAVPVGANTMSLVIDKKAWDKAGVEPKFGWTWGEYFTSLQIIQDKLGIAGDTGYAGVMYLYDLYLRQNGKAFFKDGELGFTQDDLTQWWSDYYKRVKSGIVADPKPNGFVQGSGLYDLDTGKFAIADKPVVGVSHLSAVFGLNELCAELIDIVDMPNFEEAYYDYCRCFNATKAEQKARYGSDFGSLILFQGHSRLDAYAAVRTGDDKLAERAWEKFFKSDGYTEASPWRTEKVEGPVTLVAGTEANWVYTNDTALYGLAAIENLALVGDKMP
ncbi:extracellular solute-binding protein [Streptomyces sp. BH097]|uniref:extracellular solute-binding protein n=1 Tax=unclassified Streptomyces TaxID=2593676 RepID=UPI003BB50920